MCTFSFLLACYADSMLTSIQKARHVLSDTFYTSILVDYCGLGNVWYWLSTKYPLEWHLPIKIDWETREWSKLVKKAQAWFPTISAGWHKVKMFLNCLNAPVYIRSDNQTNIWQIRAEFPSPAWNVLCWLRKFR